MKKLFSILAVAMVIGLSFSSLSVKAAKRDIRSVYDITMKDIDLVENPNRDYLIIVNKDNKYEFGGFYDINVKKDLVFTVNDVDGDTMAAEKAAYLAYTMLKAEMAKEGIKIGIYDGYRTAADQKFLIGLLRTPENPVSDVGYSESHTGLLLSIVVWDKSKNAWAETLDSAQVRADFDKMHEKALDYGFIVRYPEGKEDITGLTYRPSNMRFVGSDLTAYDIAGSGLTLEEYVANLDK